MARIQDLADPKLRELRDRLVATGATAEKSRELRAVEEEIRRREGDDAHVDPDAGYNEDSDSD